LPVVQRIAREGEIADGLRLLRGVPVTPDAESTAAQGFSPQDATTPHAVPLLGDLLIEHGAVRRAAFEQALQRYRPAEHGRIGNYMVEQGVISSDALAQAIAEQERLRAEAQAAS
jgi:bacteriophage N4 adsorption protein B